KAVEALADVARVLAVASPGVALADVPADGVAEHVIQGPRLACAACCAADDGAQLGLEVDVLRDLRDHDGAARTDDRRARLEEKLGHQLVLGEGGAVRSSRGGE